MSQFFQHSSRSSNLHNRSGHLQNCSFRGQNLSDADFRGANLRGCTFRGANLRGALFQGAQLGRSQRQWLQLILVMAIATFVSGDAVFRLIFAALGQSLVGTTGWLVIVLHTVVMLVSVAIALKTRYPAQVDRLASSFSVALLGFFYGGSWLNHTLYPAIAGAILGVGLGWGLSRVWPEGLGAIALTTVNATVTVGAGFLFSTTTISTLAGSFVVGVPLSGLTLLVLGLTWQWCRYLENRMETFGGTSFQDADLTDATFDQTHVSHTCFTGAIAPPNLSSH